MRKTFIEKNIMINAAPELVWRVFTDPAVTRLLGGEYSTDWKVGSSFGWKDADGTVYTNGKILEFEPGKLLSHNLFSLDFVSAKIWNTTFPIRSTTKPAKVGKQH